VIGTRLAISTSRQARANETTLWRVMMASRFPITLLTCLLLTGYVSAQEKATTQEAKKIAEKVKQKAARSEKAEGRQNLVKDKVTVKQGEDGQPIIEQRGEASYYGAGFQGKKTATGEKFDQNERTAAHPALPLGTKATVTNLENGKSVDVKINDRGPYVKGRDIDLSKSAAKDLGMTKDGLAPVKIEAEVSAEKNSAEKHKEKK
jgi:rare lipoprotein A (peptidoglycan hydrolase)